MPSSQYAYQAAVGRLNPRQRDALLEPGNTVLLAGPGSGKTETLVLKIARLLTQVPAPHGVACLTYGTEAARGFERRLANLGIRRGARLFTGTVHAFCLAHVLRPFAIRLRGAQRVLADCEVASEDEISQARRLALDAANVNELEQWWGPKLSAYRRLVLVDPARRAEFSDDRLPVIAKEYEKALRAAKRLDFDDIVIAALRLIESDEHVRRILSAKYPWFVIDEYQDLGLALHRIVLTLMDQAGVRVFAVGDPDQSIYGFTGARPEFLDDLAKGHDVRPIRLGLNYRCRQHIIDASLHVLQPEEDREFRAANGDETDNGEIVFHPCQNGLPEQAGVVVARVRELLDAGILPGDIGVLARRWNDLQDFEEQLTAESIPYRIARVPTYKFTPLTMWMEDMASWCAGGWRRATPRLADLFLLWERLLLNCGGRRRANEALSGRVTLHRALSALRDPQMELGDWLRSIDRALRLQELVGDPNEAPLRIRHDIRELGTMFQALASSRQVIEDFSGLARNKVVLQTIHGSKGLEYTAIFVPALEKGVLPTWNDDAREARRLFYVGITRAKREVHLLWSGFWHTAKGERRNQGPSPLLNELVRRLQG